MTDPRVIGTLMNMEQRLQQIAQQLDRIASVLEMREYRITGPQVREIERKLSREAREHSEHGPGHRYADGTLCPYCAQDPTPPAETMGT